MTLRRRLLGSVAVLTCAISLAVAGMASAAAPKAGERTFQQTFPQASKVCANVAAGTESKHLKKFAAQILANCTALHTAFTAAQTTVLAARTTLTAQIVADRAAIKTACPTPKDTAALCLNTRAVDGPAIKTLRSQRLLAVRTFYKTVEASREAFWKAFRALPGEGHAHADDPIKVQSA
ncbi:MAG TPA: hypothetical protein VNZ01_07785 [Solirubrobacteraceae bacterium]|jgi:hypothetical protein|nr:hypothetical protein [Solirubrobacteraceae bacterium]